ncbi:threonine aldolase family protein [Pedobacter flavus]|uniref:GntG family PLP-dependent aldolase n=1 Tax=Pedobacter flavus TaxID=3113906 RepID=A0ABU7GXS5_9SPHI|nr:GntG family PLP-dependent aldolase [Pedobacter sp. VNH31]MEE1883867.1 GntG family PLP-dependent aldolase [Pedobacter sp. VNH31]
MKEIDLRSDTVTQPTKGMLDAMFSAKVGDDVFGEDETVNALQEKLANLFGMEAGLFCPSGTMTNQIAIKCFTNPMDEVICDQTAHVYRYEGGGIAFNSLASVRLLNGYRGKITAEMVEPEINADNIHYPSSTLVVLENTINKGGGACVTLKEIEPIANLCKSKNLSLHLDGARIFNALTTTGDSAKDYGKYFDGISVCLSKGLGTPVGSVLLGNKAMIKKAARIRKILGGGMRQAGFLAAAGIYALDNHIDRLKIDHLHANKLAEWLLQTNYVKSVMPPESNIVLFDVDDKLAAEDVVKLFAKAGLKCNTTGPKTIRFVTHLDISSSDIDKCENIITKLNAWN